MLAIQQYCVVSHSMRADALADEGGKPSVTALHGVCNFTIQNQYQAAVLYYKASIIAVFLSLA